MRKLLQQLKSSGLITPNFVKTSDHMLRASKLLREKAVSSSKTLISFNDVGQITFEAEKFLELLEDTNIEYFPHHFMVSGRFYKPVFPA